MTQDVQKITYKGIEVYSRPHLEGGGITYGKDFVPVVKSMFPKLDTICEFCSGPGFIGFQLLANKLCDNLVLTDINPEAIEMCNRTIRKNKLNGRVRAYISGGLKNVPKNEKWDLVVSNPPHFFTQSKFHEADIKLDDKDWKIHHEFYSAIKKHLKINGHILFVENFNEAKPEFWKSFIEKHGLKVCNIFRYDIRFPFNYGLKELMFRYSEKGYYINRLEGMKSKTSKYGKLLSFFKSRLKRVLTFKWERDYPFFFVLSSVDGKTLKYNARKIIDLVNFD
jgi:predicted RNA methylase